MWKRIDYWKEKWYTDEQIKTHLDYEKKERESKKQWIQKYTEQNREKIEYVKQALKDSLYRFRNVTVDWRWFWISKPYESVYTRRKTENVFVPWHWYNHLEFYIS